MTDLHPNTAEALRDRHGEVEMVVLHDGVMVRDYDDYASDPREFTYAMQTRGSKIKVDGRAADRLEELGGATRDLDSQAARYASAGMRSPTSLDAPPSANAMMAPEAEQVRAVQSAETASTTSGKLSDKSALLRLGTPELKILAKAFGVLVDDEDTKDSLVEKISSGGSAPSDLQEQRDARDATQLAARGDRQPVHQVSDEEANRGGADGGSGSDSGDGPNATRGAQKYAAEHGVNLDDVTGTGENGRISQGDVEKHLADQST